MVIAHGALHLVLVAHRRHLAAAIDVAYHVAGRHLYGGVLVYLGSIGIAVETLAAAKGIAVDDDSLRRLADREA